QGFPVAAALAGNPKSGWAVAPQVGRAHTAVLETKEDAGFPDGTTLTFTLDQKYGGKHLLGRFRLSATAAPRPVGQTVLPDPVLKILSTAPASRTPQQKEELARYYRGIAPELAPVRGQLAALAPQEAAIRPPTTLVMKELPSLRTTHIHLRGN